MRHFPYWRSLLFHWIAFGSSIHRTFWSQWFIYIYVYIYIYIYTYIHTHVYIYIYIYIYIYSFSITRNWWPTRCNVWGYLYPNSSTCFRRSFHPLSGALDGNYSFWHSPPLLLQTSVMDEMEISFDLVHDTSRHQHRWTNRSCKYRQVFLMMGENVARNM